MSNYMAYLLLANPERLMPGARSRISRLSPMSSLETCLTRRNKCESENGEKDEDKTWSVIQGVWVEMLCLAGRCRGYLHAMSLGTGSEYLSYVWLLREYMGMETLAQRIQRTELQDEGDLGVAAPKSTPPFIGVENA
ncbi:hypothetical protein PR202_ga22138 [Eleusine coracana subsp. coracana]|uniref:Uncharacterized protein n=1 Tax=Eleusine coracana subsp. coracana TaxID=191504 RepID=A0AAV5D2D4_ELECO|nr:hypothetical protein PR202_ga22138 [Eleusine coracana subsp. coracana]